MALDPQVQSVSWAVQPISVLLFPFNRKDFELHAEHCCPEEWLHSLSSRRKEDEEEGMAQDAHHQKSQVEVNTHTTDLFCAASSLTLRYMASMDQYRQMNFA